MLWVFKPLSRRIFYESNFPLQSSNFFRIRRPIQNAEFVQISMKFDLLKLEQIAIIINYIDVDIDLVHLGPTMKGALKGNYVSFITISR
jgi:hypothetical protein